MGGTPNGAAYTATFPASAASHPMSGGTVWVAFLLPTIRRDQTYLFALTGLTGEGAVYLDVWNGETDIASRQVTLGSAPQGVSLAVALPAQVPPTNNTVQMQVRTGTFPTTVHFQASVQRVG